MIYVKIGTEERKLEDTTQQWISQTIERYRRAGQSVCVQVRFDLPDVKLRLTTPGCACVGGRALHQFNREEQRLIELWRELSLFDDPDFPPGNVVAFLRQISRRFGVAA